MLTSRQIRNQMLRQIGIQPSESYHNNVGPGDRVQVLIVEESAVVPCLAIGTIQTVHDHGWYSIVELHQENGTVRKIQLFRDGPQDYGVVECRILEKRHQRLQPDRDRDGYEWQKLERKRRRQSRLKNASA